jgi:hypothetical protein
VGQDVRTENAIGLRVGDKLDDAFVIFVGHGPAIGAEGELADPHVNPLLFCPVLREAHAGQLRIRVDDSRNDFVIYVTGFPGNHFHAGDAFLLRLVRQHRPSDDVADRVKAFDVCLEVLVNFDAAPIIHGDPELFGKHSLGESAAPH